MGVGYALALVISFDRLVALVTLVLAAAAAWAAWFSYRWQQAERRKRSDAERRLGALLARLEAPTQSNGKSFSWRALNADDHRDYSGSTMLRYSRRQGGRWSEIESPSMWQGEALFSEGASPVQPGFAGLRRS